MDLESFERAVAARRAVPEAQRAAADYLDAMARLGWAYMTRVRRLSLDPAYTPPETRQFIPETNATILLDQRLTAGAKNLAVRLVADAGQGHFVEVYTAHLAEEAGCSQRTIQRQIRELMEYSYIHAMKPNARGQTPIHISHRLRDVPEMGRFEKAVRVAPKLLALNDKQGLKETKLEQIMWWLIRLVEGDPRHHAFSPYQRGIVLGATPQRPPAAYRDRDRIYSDAVPTTLVSSCYPRVYKQIEEGEAEADAQAPKPDRFGMSPPEKARLLRLYVHDRRMKALEREAERVRFTNKRLKLYRAWRADMRDGILGPDAPPPD